MFQIQKYKKLKSFTTKQARTEDNSAQTQDLNMLGVII